MRMYPFPNGTVIFQNGSALNEYVVSKPGPRFGTNKGALYSVTLQFLKGFVPNDRPDLGEMFVPPYEVVHDATLKLGSIGLRTDKSGDIALLAEGTTPLRWRFDAHAGSWIYPSDTLFVPVVTPMSDGILMAGWIYDPRNVNPYVFGVRANCRNDGNDVSYVRLFSLRDDAFPEHHLAAPLRRGMLWWGLVTAAEETNMGARVNFFYTVPTETRVIGEFEPNADTAWSLIGLTHEEFEQMLGHPGLEDYVGWIKQGILWKCFKQENLFKLDLPDTDSPVEFLLEAREKLPGLPVKEEFFEGIQFRPFPLEALLDEKIHSRVEGTEKLLMFSYKYCRMPYFSLYMSLVDPKVVIDHPRVVEDGSGYTNREGTKSSPFKFFVPDLLGPYAFHELAHLYYQIEAHRDLLDD